MSVSYFVRYQGRPADPAAFDAHYAGPHADILKDFPGLKGLVLHKPVTWHDPYPVNDAGLHLLAQMVFESEDSLARAYEAIDEREAVRVEMKHRALKVPIYSRFLLVAMAMLVVGIPMGFVSELLWGTAP